MSKKYWVAIGEHPMFTKNDNHIFYVFPSGQVGTSGTPLMSHFVSADSLEAARSQIHAFVDERINHELHMLEMDKITSKNTEKREKYKASNPIPDSDVNQLSIGEFVNENPKAARSDTEGIMNLDDLL
jgi:hypothetical protein